LRPDTLRSASATNKMPSARRADLSHQEAGAADAGKAGCCGQSQERESSESPMLKAFWRVAPSVLLSFLAIADALVFLRAIVLSALTSLEVHARRFFFLLAIKPPLQDKHSF
jgi:hypothetical protein